MGYIAIPENPGWMLREGADAGQESSWWEIPAGFVADPANPGWYYREGSDVSKEENWVHDPSIEDPVAAEPTIENVPGEVAGRFTATPQGVILHGSRSGQNYDTAREYQATVNYVRAGAGGLGWHITCADNLIAVHMTPAEWGWSARGASQRLLACEFAQATADRPISDAQVAAFAWWFLNVARATWPNLPAYFPMHSELPEGIADGKSDVFPRGDGRADELRARILALLPFESAPATAFSLEPDHQFSLGELWPLIAQYGAQYGFDPQVLAGIVQQESSWINWRVHRDGTGAGLLGLDDGGQLPGFEQWSGLSIGRGQDHAMIPVELQLEYAAKVLGRLTAEKYGGDPLTAAQEWHRGWKNYADERGLRYRSLIAGHVKELFP